MTSTLAKADAEKTLAYVTKIAQERISKEAIAKALYIPLAPENLHLSFEKMHRKVDSSVEIVVRKTYCDQNHISLGNDIQNMKKISEYIFGDEPRFTLNSLACALEGGETLGNVLVQTSMRVLKNMERGKIIVVDAEKGELRPNPKLTESEYRNFITELRGIGAAYEAEAQRIIRYFPTIRE